MGASQSSSGGTRGARAATAEVKTSYYELLNVSRQATDDEIKKAYRRKALELHPDRNYSNVESATRLFAEVQAAYEVLSDPQERAWYDSHESAILRGDDGTNETQHYEQDVRATSADDLARMVRKFNSGVEFTDAPSGFFGFLRETFAHLTKEEEVAADWEDVHIPDFPTFGHKDDDENVVSPFYAVWSNFSTRQTFGWLDKYRLSEAPDRRVRRLMEKENQSARDEGKREFNDAVRSLVAFVRKRDPRYVPNTQTEEERQKVLQNAAAAQAARARAANMAKMGESAVPDWAKFREPEELEESEEEQEPQEIFECVACNKTFKSENQWEAHEKSKKHQKAVQGLQRKMRKDNANLNLDSEVSSSGIATPAMNDDDEAELVEAAFETEETEELDHPSHDKADEHSNNTQTNLEDVSELRDGETGSKLSTNPQHPLPNGEETGSEDDDYTSPETVQARLASTTLDADSSKGDEDDTDQQPGKPKMGKAAQKRAKRAVAAAESSEDSNYTCATCDSSFPSKTRLFQHIKDHGHAAPKPEYAGSGKGKRGRGKK